MFTCDHDTIIIPALTQLKAGNAVGVVGDSGIGKTDLATILADKLNSVLVTIEGVFLADKDVGGLPYVAPNKEGNHEYKIVKYPKIQEIFNIQASGQSVLLFIDEANRASINVLNELMAVALTKTVGMDKFGSNLYVMIAINPDDSDVDYAVQTMNPALNLRFAWFHLKASLKTWLKNYAYNSSIDHGHGETQVHASVISFVTSNPENFFVVDESKRCSPNSRTWAKLSKALYEIEHNEELLKLVKNEEEYQMVLLGILSSAIGPELAAAFLAEDKNVPLITPLEMTKPLTESMKQRIREELPVRLWAANRAMLNTITDIEKLSALASPKSESPRLLDFKKASDVKTITTLLVDGIFKFLKAFPELGKEEVMFGTVSELRVALDAKTPLTKLIEKILIEYECPKSDSEKGLNSDYLLDAAWISKGVTK